MPKLGLGLGLGNLIGRPSVGGGSVILDPTALLLHMDGSQGSQTFVDSSSNNVQITASPTRASIDTNTLKFGSGSAYFNYDSENNGGGYLTGNIDINYDDDFTIEFWVWRGYTATGNQHIFKHGDLSIVVGNGGDLLFSGSICGSINDSTFNHIAILRKNGLTKIYVNGLNTFETSSSILSQDAPFYMGAENNFISNPLNGHIDEFRIIKGIAVYDTDFIPPTSPFTSTYTPPAPFAVPTDLPNLELWLDANEGVINVLGNNFTDETASIILAGFPINNGISPPLDPNTTLPKNSQQTNGKNSYSAYVVGGDWGSNVTVNWNGSVWRLVVLEILEDGYNETVYTATGNTTYPWQATWADGTVTRTATTFDVPATNNQPVSRWTNKVSSKPNLQQLGIDGIKPVFKSDVNGRKAVFFNGEGSTGDALSNSGFSFFGSQYSYYLVATDLGGSLTTTNVACAIRLGTSTTTTGRRAIFGANNFNLNFQNANTRSETDLSLQAASSSSTVFSMQANVAAQDVVIRRNFESRAATPVSTSAANSDVIIIGAANTNGSSPNNRAINSNFSEVLVYRTKHDDATAEKIINYLVQKWNIDPNL